VNGWQVTMPAATLVTNAGPVAGIRVSVVITDGASSIAAIYNDIESSAGGAGTAGFADERGLRDSKRASGLHERRRNAHGERKRRHHEHDGGTDRLRQSAMSSCSHGIAARELMLAL